MLHPETSEFMKTARGRRQIEISVRLIEPPSASNSRPDLSAEMREQAWRDVKEAVLNALSQYAGDGLRVLRLEKTRPGLIMTGPAAAWRRFIEEELKLLKDPRIEFRRYSMPWSFGLPGFPE